MALAEALALLANFVIVPAVAYGSQLALGALGVTLIYAVLRFAHFAHGDLMALATAAVIFGTWGLQAMGVSAGPLPTALLALPLGALVATSAALIAEKTVYRHFRAKNSPPVIFVIASVGVLFVLGGLTRLAIGAGDRTFADGERFVFTVREFRDATGLDQGIALKSSQLLTVVVAFVAMAALFWFLERSRSGKAMRAFADNEDLALLSGVDPGRTVALAWTLAAVLATLAGALYGLDKSFRPFTYHQLLLPIFAAAIVGGLGKPVGAVIGAYIVAFSEVGLTYAYKQVIALATGWTPDGLAQLLSTDYKFAISFVILVIVLLLRPHGVVASRPS